MTTIPITTDQYEIIVAEWSESEATPFDRSGYRLFWLVRAGGEALQIVAERGDRGIRHEVHVWIAGKGWTFVYSPIGVPDEIATCSEVEGWAESTLLAAALAVLGIV